MESAGYEQSQRDSLELPEGYTVKTVRVLEEESGEVRRVLLLRRANGSVAGVFTFGASNPTVESVSRSAWDDYQVTEVV